MPLLDSQDEAVAARQPLEPVSVVYHVDSAYGNLDTSVSQSFQITGVCCRCGSSAMEKIDKDTKKEWTGQEQLAVRLQNVHVEDGDTPGRVKLLLQAAERVEHWRESSRSLLALLQNMEAVSCCDGAISASPLDNLMHRSCSADDRVQSCEVRAREAVVTLF